MDTSGLDLGDPLPDIFGGVEGNELLSLDYAKLVSLGDSTLPAGAGPQQAPDGELGHVADAARSVLASLGSTPQSPIPAPAQQHAPSATATPPRLPQQLDAPPLPQRALPPPLGYMLAGAPVFVDAATGQIIHTGGPQILPPSWGGAPHMAGGQYYAPLPQYLQQYHPHQVQYVVQCAPPGSPSMHAGYGPGVAGPWAPSPEPPAPKKSPPKRRRASKVSAASAKTVAQQCAKAEQGYTFE